MSEAASAADVLAPAPRERPATAGRARPVARAGALSAMVCGVIAAAWIQWLFAWFGPTGNAREDLLYRVAWYATFMARTFLFHAGLAAGVALIAGLLIRRPLLALAALPVVLVGVPPELGSPRSWANAVSRVPDLRVMTVNLLFDNERYDEVFTAIFEDEPDILLVQEYTLAWHQQFQARVTKRYPHFVSLPGTDPSGVAIYSRLPFKEVGLGTAEREASNQIPAPRFPAQRVVIDVAGRDVAVYNVHLFPPTPRRAWPMRRQFRELHRILAGETRFMIVGGDFNCTARSGMHEELSGLGLADTIEAAGFGRFSTWPVKGPFRFLPGVRIDRFYTSEGLAASGHRTVPIPGSDHRAVVADIAWNGDPPAGP